MENFYCVGHAEKRGTPYAPTIVSGSDLYLSDCPQCGRQRFNKENTDLSLVIEGKRTPPDYLMCGHFPLTLVSGKVMEVWQKHNVTGYTAFPIKKLLDLKRNELDTDVQYFNVTITGKVELDFEKMGVSIENQCPLCGSVEYNKQIWLFGDAAAKPDSYDGSDLFAAKHFPGSLLCTRKLLEIVYAEKLTNFQFRSFESKFDFLDFNAKIDLKTYLKSEQGKP